MIFSRLPLGGPLKPDPAGYQARKFKELLRARLPVPGGLSLLTVVDEHTRERSVVAACQSPEAVAWAREAMGIAGEVWAEVAGIDSRRLVR